jgi:hypothetical protein
MSDISIVCAIDENDMVIGTYAVDSVTKELPGVAHAELRDFPNAPVRTGRKVEQLIDPDRPELGTELVDELGWPGPGWSWNPHVPAWAGPPEHAQGNPKNPNA